jgi:hypothetical protein
MFIITTLVGATILKLPESHIVNIFLNLRKQNLNSLDFLLILIHKQFSKKRFFDFGSSNEEEGLKLNGD